MKKRSRAFAFIFAVLPLIGAGCGSSAPIRSFEECAAAGYPVMESYPRQCRAEGNTYVEWAAPPSSEQAVPGEPFTPHIGQSRGIGNDAVLTLVGIDDSRCKPDVQCIWAGELSARFRLESANDVVLAQEFSLGTARAGSAQFPGLVLTLKDASTTTATVIFTR